MLRVAIIIVAGLLAGLLAGWALAPRHAAPGGDPEARLRERAAEYYRASKLFRFGDMARMFSPARQLRDADKLAVEIEATEAQWPKLPKHTRDDLQFGADSITAERIEVRIEGDWASTRGSSDLRPSPEADLIKVPLEDLVWVRSGGDWWLFSFSLDEINRYGNPPDFALEFRNSGGGTAPAATTTAQ